MSAVSSGGKTWVPMAVASVAVAALTYRVASQLLRHRAKQSQSPADRAWDRLYDEWVELGTAFMTWWQAQGMDVRMTVLRTARDAVRAELGKSAAAIDTLCPELSDGRVSRVAESGVLPLLIDARLRDPETSEAHDERFAAANVGPGHPIEVVVAASHNRALLVLSTFFNVLSLARQMGVVPAPAPPVLK